MYQFQYQNGFPKPQNLLAVVNVWCTIDWVLYLGYKKYAMFAKIAAAKKQAYWCVSKQNQKKLAYKSLKML